MTTEATRAVIEDMIDAYKRGDHARMAALYADDVEWRFHAPEAIFPFPSERRGKFDVLAGFLEIYRDYKYVSYDLIMMTVEGERCATLANVKMICRATGQTITGRLGAFHRVLNGQIVSYDGYADRYARSEQPREVSLPA